MGFVKIKEDIAKISAVVDRWEKSLDVSDIERDIILSMLRSAYQNVLFLRRDDQSARSEGLSDQIPVAECDAPGHQPAPESEDIFMQEEEPQVVAEPVAEPEMEPEAEFEVISVAVEPEPEKPVATLFDDDPVMQQPAPRSGLDRHIVLSLYDDGYAAGHEVPATRKEDIAVPKPEVREMSAPVAEPAPEVIPFVVADASPSDRPHQVLGEVIGVGERLGDTLSREAAKGGDLASRVASAQTQSLRQSIGINDKFLIINEVFHGNAPAYEEIIDELDAFEDMDELMIYIHDKYAWNPNNEGVKTLIELLTRKFS